MLLTLTPGPDGPSRRRRRRGLPLAIGLTAAAFVAGGAAGALADARKSVTLDVDGSVTHVTTFAGSVGGLLDRQGVRVGPHDAVAPGLASRLRDGSDVVVRYGRQLDVESGGASSTTWVTALDADDALAQLSARGSDVRLVASRSGDRTALPLPLAAHGGPVAVVADGHTRTVRDAGDGVAGVLAAAHVTVGTADLVSVIPVDAPQPGGARVELVVQRVVTRDVTTRTPIPFRHVEKQDPGRYADLAPAVLQTGVAGVHTRVERVTTVDGRVTARTVVSDADTTAAVDEVVAVGTQARPAAPPPAAAPAAPAATTAPAAPPAAPTGDVWAALAQCESGGRVDAVSSNGLYYGLYQFTVSTWQSLGGTGLPSQASAAEQTQRAQALQARSGWGQWPACARKLGLL